MLVFVHHRGWPHYTIHTRLDALKVVQIFAFILPLSQSGQPQRRDPRGEAAGAEAPAGGGLPVDGVPSQGRVDAGRKIVRAELETTNMDRVLGQFSSICLELLGFNQYCDVSSFLIYLGKIISFQFTLVKHMSNWRVLLHLGVKITSYSGHPTPTVS